MESLVLKERDGGVALITLNRPDKLNAFAGDMRQQLLSAVESVAADLSVRVLVITGRETDVVNVGGDKRSLAVIERQVREHEGIVDAGAFVVEGALGVPEVRVAVVAAPGVDVAGLAARLASHGELPRGTRFVAAADIPRNALGKVDRAALLAQAGGRAPAAATRP